VIPRTRTAKIIMSKYLITGGEGFIGGAIVSEAGGMSFDIKSGFDILDEKQLPENVRRCRRIFHCAAKISVPESVSMPDKYYRTNVEGTRSVLKAVELFDQK